MHENAQLMFYEHYDCNVRLINQTVFLFNNEASSFYYFKIQQGIQIRKVPDGRVKNLECMSGVSEWLVIAIVQ